MGAQFMKSTYHTNYDTKATYNEKAFTYNHQLYAQIVYELDQKAVMPMDFTTRFNESKLRWMHDYWLKPEMKEKTSDRH